MTIEQRIGLAELTRRLGLCEHEQWAVLSWTSEPDGTTWSEDEAAELIAIWHAESVVES